MVQKSVIFGGIALLGGLVMIGAVFLPWAVVGNGSALTDYSGLQLYTDGRFADEPQRVLGLVAAAFGTLIIIGETVSLMSPRKAVFKTAGAVVIFALIGAIAVAVFQLWDLPAASGGRLLYGAPVAVVGAVIALLAAMNQLKLSISEQ
ncbi:MAG: hypothetical protein WC132_03355 [Methanomethylophilus sp.]